MKQRAGVLLLIATVTCSVNAQIEHRREAEYYVAAYAQHYRIPVDFVRAIVDQESGWDSCAVSNKGAVGLMQLMPDTAKRLGVRHRCNINENVSAGVRLLAVLAKRFDGDLRLVAAAYYTGAAAIERRRLDYANPGVVTYVAGIRARAARYAFERESNVHHTWGKGL